MKPEPLDKKLDRYRTFWRQAPTDRPILGLTLTTDTPMDMLDSIEFPREGALYPDDLDLDVFMKWYEQDFQANQALAGDQFWVAVPFWGIPWLEAILGCQVQISGNAIWAEHFLDNYRDLPEFNISITNPWLEKLLEFTNRLVDRFGGRYPVAPPFMRGPSDLITALRGPQRFLLDLYDYPDEVGRLGDSLADIWINVVKRVLDLIPRFHGGYCNGNRQVWSPGTCIETQEDAIGMASPQIYRDLFLSNTQRIVSNFDFGWIHIHSGYHHNIEELLTIPELAAIEFTIDAPSVPSIEELIPVIQKIQKHKPIIVHGRLCLEEMECLVHNLSPEGLCVISRVASVEVGNEMLEELLSGLPQPKEV